jgi:hypothetical protein
MRTRNVGRRGVPTVTHESIFSDLRGGGWRDVESTKFTKGFELGLNSVEYPSLGPTLHEVKERVIVNIEISDSEGRTYTGTDRVDYRPRLIPRQIAAQWLVERWETEYHLLERTQTVEQSTPDGYNRSDLSDLRAFRLSRFLTYNSPNIAGSYHHGVTPVALIERGGKIRVASSHPAYLAHYSRCLAKTTLPFLKATKVCRDKLYGEPIKLSNRSRAARLYSADLSAASDWIDHKIGRATLEGLLTGLGMSDPEIQTALRCIEPYRIQADGHPLNGKLTSRGAHMGLGTTWTVLSLLNYFAGEQADTSGRSFRICGDDLIALWTPLQVGIYETVLKELGLVINKTKSFIGTRGVFCEKLVQITSFSKDGVRAEEYTFKPMPTLKELVPEDRKPTPIAVQTIHNFSKDAKLMAPIRNLAANTCRTISKWRGTINGPASLGGNGCTRVAVARSKQLIKTFLIKGPFTLHLGGGSEALSDRLENYRFSRTTNPEAGPRYDDIMVGELSADRCDIINQFKSTRERLSVDPEAWRTWCEAKKGKKTNKYSYKNALKRWTSGTRGFTMMEAINGSRWITAKMRYRLKKLELGKFKDSLASWKRKITTLTTRTPVHYLPLDVLEQHPPRSYQTDQSGKVLEPKWRKRGTPSL